MDKKIKANMTVEKAAILIEAIHDNAYTHLRHMGIKDDEHDEVFSFCLNYLEEKASKNI